MPAIREPAMTQTGYVLYEDSVEQIPPEESNDQGDRGFDLADE